MTSVGPEGLAETDLAAETAEPLPDREVLSLLATPGTVPAGEGMLTGVDGGSPTDSYATTGSGTTDGATAVSDGALADAAASESGEADITDADRNETITSSDSASAAPA